MSKARIAAKKGAKVTSLALAMLVFALLLLFILGIVVDRFFISPHNF